MPPDPIEAVPNRVVENLVLSVVALAAAGIANSIGRTASPEVATAWWLLFGLANYGIIIGIIGLVVATVRGGLIGMLGFTIELASTAGIESGDFHLGGAIIGAFLVVVGPYVWSWALFYEIVSELRGGGGMRR